MFSVPFFHHSHRIFPKNLKMLFLSKLFRSVGVQFHTFFMPLFLYEIGSKFQVFDISPFQNGMILLGMYYLFERIVVFFVTLPVSQFSARVGLRNSMVISQFLYMIVLALYVLSERNPAFLLLVILMDGIKLPLFWCSYYSLFSTQAFYKRMGESVGTVEFFTRLMQAAIPAISGLIIVQWGFSYVFFISLFFQALAVLMLFFIKETQTVTQPQLTEMKGWLKESQFRMFGVSIIGKYASDSLQSLWPLFVLILIGSADKVGFLYFIVFFISLLLAYFAGWYVDHFKSRRPFSITGSILSSLWVARFFLSNIWTIMVVDTLGHMVNSVYSPFYDSIMLRRAKGDRAFPFFTYREIMISFAGVIFWGVFILYFVFTDSWRNFILFGFIAVLMSMQLRDKQHVAELEIEESKS
jgi:MFS family permease